MRTFILQILCALVVSIARGDVPAISVSLANNEPSHTVHVVAGQPAEIPLAVRAPADAPMKLRVQLFQAATSIAAPVGSAVEIGEVVIRGGAPHAAVDATIPMPAVKAPTQFVARFSAKVGGSDELVPAGVVRLVAYPSNAMDALRSLARTMERVSGLRFGVFGRSKEIRAFFKEQKIPFRDLGQSLPDRIDGGLLAIGSLEDSKESDRGFRPGTASNLILFTPDPTLASGVYTSSTRDGTVTKVTLPILVRLPTDPLSQHTFLQILTQHYRAMTPSDSQ
jgi:hypothetical protein